MGFDLIWDRARSDLLIQTGRGDVDPFLWEHSARIAHNALNIAKLSVVRSQSPDEAALIAAALYHDAGWIVRLRAHELERNEILARPVPSVHREQGAVLMESSLSEILSPESLDIASRAVRSLNERDIDFIEGQVITEAENLDEFGLLSLWPTIRRGVLEGRAVQALIDTWHRRKEYRFWQARLNDSFRFTRVREIAQKRLEAFERFMQDLEKQSASADIDSVATKTAPESVNTPSVIQKE